MFVSHRYQFIVFPDPLGSSAWLNRALGPFVDQQIGATPGARDDTLLFHQMTPQEAEIAFSLTGLTFANYMKVAIVENPFKRMARLYDRIAISDPVWQLREKLGGAHPTFGHWLKKTKAHGVGAGTRFSPRWQRLGAWSADVWAANRIDHFVRADAADHDLRQIFRQLNFAADAGSAMRTTDKAQFLDMARYDPASTALIKQRYQSDLEILHCQQHELHLAA